MLGASLGLVFVPCAGPVLAAVTVIAAKRDVGLDAVVLTLSYALGAAVPMLAIAFVGRRGAKALRIDAELVRRVCGALVLVAAIAIAFGLDQKLQTKIPGYTESIQNRFERSDRAQRELEELTGAKAPKTASGDTAEGELEDYGAAPDFTDVAAWLNSKPLTLAQLRGRVVLIDFWTYSCINCLRTLPYIKEWDARYRQLGLTIVGVHSPEFAFEHKESNVRANVKRLGLRYPVALDNDFGTWQAWSNQYWPAKYLIDRAGHVRFYHFGEGDYAKTEDTIRTLLAEPGMSSAGGLGARRREPARTAHARELSRLPAPGRARRGRSRARRRAHVLVPDPARHERDRLRGSLEDRRRACDRRPRCAAAPELPRP